MGKLRYWVGKQPAVGIKLYTQGPLLTLTQARACRGLPLALGPAPSAQHDQGLDTPSVWPGLGVWLTPTCHQAHMCTRAHARTGTHGHRGSAPTLGRVNIFSRGSNRPVSREKKCGQTRPRRPVGPSLATTLESRWPLKFGGKTLTAPLRHRSGSHMGGCRGGAWGRAGL